MVSYLACGEDVTVDVGAVLDWLARIALVASAARVGLHWGRDGLKIWFKPESAFWPYYTRIEDTLGWLSVSLAKFGKRERVAEDAIKEVFAHPPGTNVDVTVTAIEPKE